MGMGRVENEPSRSDTEHSNTKSLTVVSKEWMQNADGIEATCFSLLSRLLRLLPKKD